MALILEDTEFQHILRVLNTNVDGREHVSIALTKVPHLRVRVYENEEII
jgi:hypothetical protein